MVIKNNDERLIIVGDVRLLPGCNEVNKKEWDKMTKPSGKKAPEYDVSYSLGKGDIEIISIKEMEGKEEIEKFEFREFSVNKRKEILENTYSIKTLEEWIPKEEDTSLRYLMEKRIDAIKSHKLTDIQKYGKPKNHT